MAVERPSRWGYLQSPEAWTCALGSIGSIYLVRRIWKSYKVKTPSPIKAKVEEIQKFPLQELIPKEESELLISTYRQIGSDLLTWNTDQWQDYLEWVKEDPCNALGRKLTEMGWTAETLQKLQPNSIDYLELLHSWEK